MGRGLVIACVVGGLAIGTTRADLVYFARGGQADLPTSTEGDRVRLDAPDGPKTFPRSDFAAIVREPAPVDEWATRQSAAIRIGTLSSRFAAAWWALEHGLTPEATQALVEIRPLAGREGPAARSIAALGRLAAPCPDPDLEPIRSRLRPLRFLEVRSPRAVLFHQLAAPDARERLDLIGRVVETFVVALAAQGVELPAPRGRLVSVVFADRRDYVAFLRRADAEAFADTQGYYHPILHATFGFDGRGSEAQQVARRAIANLRVACESASELDRRSLLLDLERRATDLGILAHETVHQLTAETGLAARPDDFPTWLHEGLAAQFEVVRGGRWAGFGRLNDQRLPDWRAIRPAPRLAPLIRDAGFGHGYRRDLYAQSWALVYFLRKAHPREFLTFLDLLRAPRAEAITQPDRAFEAFRSAMGGDLAAIEAEWHRFLQGLETPLERARPSEPRVEVPADLDRLERRLVEAGSAH